LTFDLVGLPHCAEGRARFRQAARRVRRIRLLIRFGSQIGMKCARCMVPSQAAGLFPCLLVTAINAAISVKHTTTIRMTAMIEVEWSSIALG
jgi:hypothetical protein